MASVVVQGAFDAHAAACLAFPVVLVPSVSLLFQPEQEPWQEPWQEPQQLVVLQKA